MRNLDWIHLRTYRMGENGMSAIKWYILLVFTKFSLAINLSFIDAKFFVTHSSIKFKPIFFSRIRIRAHYFTRESRIATPNRLFIIFFSSSHNDTDTCTTVNTPSTTERSWPPAHRWWWSNVVHSMHAAEAKNNNKIVSGEKKGKTKARLENSPQSASTLTH